MAGARGAHHGHCHPDPRAAARGADGTAVERRLPHHRRCDAAPGHLARLPCLVAPAMRAWRRLRYPLIAASALAFLAAMVVSGAMPQQRQFVRFEAKGVLMLPPERILRVE